MLEKLVHHEIQEKGPITQSRFMELALQHSTYGYYRSQEAIGQDFTTSPEISQVFGEIIGAWAMDYYEKLGQPKTLSLVELGPGKGTLMADFLRISKICPAFSRSLKIHMVEINPLLKLIQQKTVSHPLHYAETFYHIPLSPDPLILIANEFFDVLPTNCYVRKDNVLYERYVDYQEGKLSFTLLKCMDNPGPDQTWEESPFAIALMKEICLRLLKQRGIFLCIDYGYEQGYGESLQALFRKEFSDPLCHVGKSDLTCHVNFGRLKDIALLNGLGVCGPIPQGQFLKNIGLDIRIEMLKYKNPSERENLDMSAKRLTNPQQMGKLFKVMAIFSPPTLIPLGFEE